MQTNQDWIEAYKEICAIIKDPTKGVTEISLVDLDYDQLNNEIKEYPIPTHSVFMDFSATDISTTGLNVQDMDILIGFTYAFKTMSDTHHGSDNQSTALAFGVVIRKLHALLQAKSGTHFSSLDRVGLVPAPAPPYYIAYKMTYKTIIRDYAAMKEYDDSKSLAQLNIVLEVDENPPPSSEDSSPLYQVDL